MKKTAALIMALLLMLSLTACAAIDIILVSRLAGGCGQKESKDAAQDNSVDPGIVYDDTIEETVLVDDPGIRITALSLDKWANYQLQLQLLFENSTGKDLTFEPRNVSINNCMIDTYMKASVPDGQQSVYDLILLPNDLQAPAMRNVAEIELSFFAYDSNSDEHYYDSDYVTLKTSAAGIYNYQYDDIGEVVYDSDDAKIVVMGLERDTAFPGFNLLVYIENKSEKDIIYQMDSFLVNGHKVYPIFSPVVRSGKCTFDTASIMRVELKNYKIIKIKNIELSFKFIDPDSWEKIKSTDTVTLKY